MMSDSPNIQYSGKCLCSQAFPTASDGKLGRAEKRE